MRRNRWVLAALAGAAALVASGCSSMIGAMGKPQLQGEGPVKTENRDLATFSGVDARGVFEVDINVGKEQSVSVEAQENLVPEISTRVEGGKLIIDSDKSLTSDKPIRVLISVKELNELNSSGASNVTVAGLSGESFVGEVSGAGNVRISGSSSRFSLNLSGAAQAELENLSARELNLEMSGAGKVVATGTAEEAKLDLSGAGEFKGERLAMRRADVVMSGAGTAHLNVAELLKVDASGAGTIRYKGDPEVQKNLSGGSSIKRTP